MAQIKSGASADLLTVDATSKAGRVSLYDSAGNLITPLHRAALALTAGGVLQSGKDYNLARTLRSDETGTLRTSDESLFLYDNTEGAAVDTGKWIQTTSTSTITQAATTGVLFNAGSSVTTNQGAMHTSHRQLPIILGAPLLARFKARPTAHFANGVIELGFGEPATAIATTMGNGALWRKDTAGQWLPVVTVNNVEALGTPISNATFIASVPTTDYAMFTIELTTRYARFEIRTQAGALVHSQDIEFATVLSGTAGFAVTHLRLFARQWNNGAVGTAVQLFVKNVMVVQLDAISQRPYNVSQSGMSMSSLTSPTTYLQAAQYANSADPAAAVLANITASYTTLGGLFIGPTPTPAGALTDFPLFGFTVPVPYTFIFTGVKITAMNRGAAVAVTATVLEWAMGFNSSAQSLATAAPYSPMKVAIGRMVFPIAAVAESLPTPGEVSWVPATPIAVQGGRFVHVILRIPVGTATASGFLRGSVVIDGYFE